MAETAIVSLNTLPVGLPLPTISKNSLYTLFCSLILDHGVLLKISISAPKIISNFLLDTSFHHSFQSVTIRFYLLLSSIQVVQFQNGYKLLRLSCSFLYNPSKMSSCGIFVMDNPSDLKNRIPEYRHFVEQWSKGRCSR